MNPSFLFIVPTLNSYLLLPKLLQTLDEQHFQSWRLIFIDGPSNVDHRQWLDAVCASDHRYSWFSQPSDHLGIFGAMNMGFSFARGDEWVLFWGSDDWAASPHVLAAVISAIQSADRLLHLVVCRGRYADASTAALGRTTSFQPEGLFDSAAYRRALWFGSTPPHQATLFGPGVRFKLGHYSQDFLLSADLDYFLQLSRHADLCVQCLDLELVHMADGGVSGQQPQRRLKEVYLAYLRAFGWLWWFPFFARYARRLVSLLPAR
jgi:glycosyltransferase involved in cell wall biosynthesis